MANPSSDTPGHESYHLSIYRKTQSPRRDTSTEDFDPYEVSQDVQPAPDTSSTWLSPGPPKSQPTYKAMQVAEEEPAGPAPRSWLPRWRKSIHERVSANFDKRFRGRWGRHNMRKVYWPRASAGVSPEEGVADGYIEADSSWGDPRGEVVKTADGKFVYRNQLHQIGRKYKDTAVYLSPTRTTPRRLVVQATGAILNKIEGGADTGDWIRTRIEGSVPAVLKLSEWAMGPLGSGRWWNKVDAALRILLISAPLQVMLALSELPDWDDVDVADTYTDFPGYHWDWPKYATNLLDEQPGPDGLPRRMGSHASDVRARSTRPNKIVMRTGADDWEVVDAKDYPFVRYIFISYQWTKFREDPGKIERMARDITKKKGYRAYWLDTRCNHQGRSLEVDHDVYTMCDVVRSSGLVAILLPENTTEARLGWGSRLWTLPEGLLAPGNSVVWCHEVSPGALEHGEVNKIEMTSTFWGETDEAAGAMYTEQGGSPVRVLAEHYSGLLTLSRLELLPSIIYALAAKGWDNVDSTHSDLAYAVMGFLHYRLERNVEDTLFQNLARLSLSNDSDRIIERMISILPQNMAARTAYPPARSAIDNSDLFDGLALPDQFGTRVQDVTPLCDVIGVAHEDNTVIIDNCKAIHIRWKNFPRPVVVSHHGRRKTLAAWFIAAGLWWLAFGCELTINWLPYWAYLTGEDTKTEVIAWVAGGFFIVALILSVAAPFSVRRLLGGMVEKSSPSLVAFEGVMPIAQVEQTVFGNNKNRLTYAPSSTPFCALRRARHPRERKGVEPHWISQPEAIHDDSHDIVPAGHHLFTLVDMGDLTVSIFSAERPPTVALLCGREGGMVRAVLCSWRFESDCLYKETVMRMPSTVYEHATPKDWLKLCLQSQNQAGRNRSALLFLALFSFGFLSLGLGLLAIILCGLLLLLLLLLLCAIVLGYGLSLGFTAILYQKIAVGCRNTLLFQPQVFLPFREQLLVALTVGRRSSYGLCHSCLLVVLQALLPLLDHTRRQARLIGLRKQDSLGQTARLDKGINATVNIAQ
ncbi:hypothetical protein VPNG_07948 [Cytospora leucostoma]|uniref:Heterokaryon incompatibility domain-containing protein n=1 Tax=Cytospora leucostoma TaxID=1230097 RepID=A0A423WAT4_9PEZI|nr:hypothetical protein VPNG_07948 [Cytospora leucostoma]